MCELYGNCIQMNDIFQGTGQDSVYDHSFFKILQNKKFSTGQ